jgi:ubiquitin carboxyl-terminal hydrolase 8
MADENKGLLGLANLGNTCFMNAVIQALRNNKEWTHFCLKDTIKPYVRAKDSPQKKILLAYIDLLQTFWNGTGPGYVQPAGFFTDLKVAVKDTIYEDFAKRQPQDAHEFLVWLLDQMYMATQGEVNITIKNEGSIEPMILQALKAWRGAFEKQWSPLTDLVFGLYRIQYVCSACKTVHTRWETFNNLKYTLHMKDGKPMSLLECLALEFQEETIDEYDCDICSSKPENSGKKVRQPASKKVHIWRLPKLLILTAKRFAPDMSKIHFPMEECISARFDTIFATESHEPSKHVQYDMFATVDHHGSHFGGHYTCQAKLMTTNEWYRFDDDGLMKIGEPRLGHSTYLTMWSAV